jgi:carboxypeptidase Q
MKKVGLSNVHLEPWIAPEGWQRGKAVARLIEPGNGRSISLASMGWRPGTRGKIVGDVVIIKAETLKELNAYKGKLKNAIVLQRAPTKVRELDKVDQQGALGRAMRPDRARTNYREMQEVRRAMTDFLMKEGVAAVLQDAGKPLGLLVTTGGWGRRDQLPSLFVAHNHYEMLWRLAGRPSPARTRMELEVTNETIPGPIKVYNTVGEIPGTDKTRDEVVVVGAHLDSWDLGQGATDNGTGSTVVLEAARVLVKSGIKPKRTIRFILFTGEEQGLHGSRAYVKEHADEMKRVSAALVHDTGTGRVIGVGVGGRPKAQEIL